MPIRTLVVDDTVTYRKIASEIVSSLSEIELVGTAPNGMIALKKLAQSKTDLVFLDVHMPEMDGVETLKRIRSEFPDVTVVMMSGISSRNTSDTIEALQSGAIDFIRKPDSNDFHANNLQLKNDIQSVIKMMGLKKGSLQLRTPRPPTIHKPLIQPRAVVPRTSILQNLSFEVCVIGVSTGGPEALNKLIPSIPADFPIPILVVQHMPPHFTRSLAESLNKKSKIRVIEAPENEIIKRGTVYIAPGGKHMVIRNSGNSLVIGHSDSPPENSCKPSVDVLFRSVASYYNGGVLAIVLTGMGNDGCSGVRSLKRQKCYCITQMESSCVVYGMPRAVDEAQLSDQSLPIESIAPEMVSLTSRMM
jgi:two-component system, chemotaxis family, protein-glutamate methylesterase/glutaminase